MVFKESKNEESGANDYVWTYKMEDGFRTVWRFLVAAAKFGLPESILQRVQHFGSTIDNSPARVKVNHGNDGDGSSPVEETSDAITRSGSESISLSNADKNLQGAVQFAEQLVGSEDRAI